MAERKDVSSKKRNERSPREIHEEIAKRRSEMRDTINALENKVSADHLKGKVRDELRSIGKAGSKAIQFNTSVFDTIRENPIPAAMASVGLIWLFSKSAGDGGRYVSGKGYGAEEKAGEIKGKAEEISGEVKAKAEDISGMAKEKAGELKAKYGEVSGRARERVGEYGELLSRKAGRAKSRFSDTLHDNPLSVLASAFAIGAVIGLVLPETRKEEELLGETGERMREKAEEVTEEAAEKAEEDIDRAA